MTLFKKPTVFAVVLILFAPYVFSALPDPLLSQTGQPVKTAKEWKEQRRPEILELFRTHVYGRAPVGRPKDLVFKVIEENTNAMGGKATLKRIEITFSGPGGSGKIEPVIFIPNNRKSPAPGFLLISHRGKDNLDPTREKRSPFWPAEEIIARGYAAIGFYTPEVDPDKHDGFKDGVHGIFDPRPEGQRPGDAWGTIAAWAWGASRVMDYLETDKDIDATRIGVLGHSRGGKAALWAGAQDERFGIVISNDSGSTGAALARGKQGESIAAINKSFPHWFCANYKTYNNREEELPVDQHMLLSLMAPRPVYVASATKDQWADPANEFRSAVSAAPVFRLFGLEGLKTSTMPPPDKPINHGHIGYHLREGSHNLGLSDWNWFMDFADKHLRNAPLPVAWEVPPAKPAKNASTKLTGDYLGQTPPGMSVEMFAPEIISTADNFELNSVFSPKGDEFIFTRGSDSIGSGNIMIMKRINNVWTKPEVISFCRDYPGVDPSMSPGGDMIFYASGRPLSGTGEAKKDYDLWMVHREGDGWGEPVHLGNEVNTDGRELYPVFTAKNHLYWRADRPGSLGGGDIWRASFKDGKFTDIVNVGPAINTSGNEGDVYVSPDEDYLIVVSEKDGRGLYISFNQDGKWTPTVNMGPTINKGKGEFCPMVSPDGKYFFFTARNNNKGDIYWISAGYLKTLRPATSHEPRLPIR